MQIGIELAIAHELALSKALADHNPTLLRSGGHRLCSEPLYLSAHDMFCSYLACHFDHQFQSRVSNYYEKI